MQQRLIVGVAKHKGHILDAFLVHVVYGIASATTNSDDLDDGLCHRGKIKIQKIFHILSVDQLSLLRNSVMFPKKVLILPVFGSLGGFGGFGGLTCFSLTCFGCMIGLT